MDNNNKGENDSTQNENVTESVENNIKEKSNTHNLSSELNKYKKQASNHFSNTFLLVCIIGVSLGILLEVINAVNRKQSAHYSLTSFNQNTSTSCIQRRTYWIHANTKEARSNTSYLKHVHLVLQRLGYEQSTDESSWNLLWAHKYPFSDLNLRKLSPEQKVYHFPGIGYISNKVDLATTDSKYIPKAFRLPQDTDKFIKYAESNKNAMFVQKNNLHRHIHLKNVTDIDLTSGENFVQEFMQKPFLIDGHKFDLGVYVVITSVNPLRVYWYTGDILFRYCPEKYYPLDPQNYNKYVVGDRYLPTWEIPSLAHLHSALGFSMKESFDAYVRSIGKDPAHMWEEVLKAISEVIIKKEHLIVNILKKYSSSENFFEMLRFDFIVDENLKVFLLEANMSPNLSSERLLPNQLLYEQVLYNLFSITGIARKSAENNVNEKESVSSKTMVTAQKNIAVFSEECSTLCKNDCRALELCKLCKTCLNPTIKKILLDTHTEALHTGDFRRLIPPTLFPIKDPSSDVVQKQIEGLTPNNRLLHLWYQGKCNQDLKWCT